MRRQLTSLRRASFASVATDATDAARVDAFLRLTPDASRKNHRLPLPPEEAYDLAMKIQLSHPERQVEIKGPKRVRELLRDLNLVAEAHLVIRGDDLVTEDEMLKDTDEVEVRPVISGGSVVRRKG